MQLDFCRVMAQPGLTPQQQLEDGPAVTSCLIRVLDPVGLATLDGIRDQVHRQQDEKLAFVREQFRGEPEYEQLLLHRRQRSDAAADLAAAGKRIEAARATARAALLEGGDPRKGEKAGRDAAAECEQIRDRLALLASLVENAEAKARGALSELLEHARQEMLTAARATLAETAAALLAMIAAQFIEDYFKAQVAHERLRDPSAMEIPIWPHTKVVARFNHLPDEAVPVSTDSCATPYANADLHGASLRGGVMTRGSVRA